MLIFILSIIGIIIFLIFVTVLINMVSTHFKTRNGYDVNNLNEQCKKGLAAVNHNNYSKEVPVCFDGAEKALRDNGIENFSVKNILRKK